MKERDLDVYLLRFLYWRFSLMLSSSRSWICYNVAGDGDGDFLGLSHFLRCNRSCTATMNQHWRQHQHQHQHEYRWSMVDDFPHFLSFSIERQFWARFLLSAGLQFQFGALNRKRKATECGKHSVGLGSRGNAAPKWNASNWNLRMGKRLRDDPGLNA